MKTVDIIIPVMGNLPVVKDCIESLYPLPDGWSLYIYDSNVSEIDGTKEYLKSAQLNKKFKLIDEDKFASHGEAVQRLIAECKSDWILHVDSDAKLLDKNFYTRAQHFISKEKFKVWGRVDPTSVLPEFDRIPKIKLLRTYSWNILFDRNFFQTKKLSFSPKKVDKQIKFENQSQERLFLWGDTSWQLFWESSRLDLFGRYPDEMWKCWKHLDHATVNWKLENKEKISEFIKNMNKPKNPDHGFL